MTANELKLISYLARDGLTLDEIRDTLGIKKGEWKKFLKENPEEKKRLKLLSKTIDYEVEDALLKRALGYKSTEHRETEKPNGTEYVTTEKEVPPDVRAAALWLKCRRSEIWDDKYERSDEPSVAAMLKELEEEAQNEDE